MKCCKRLKFSMSKRDDQTSLKDMRSHACEAIALLDSRSLADLSDNRVLQLALTRLVEIIGEAAYRVTPEMKGRHSSIPWGEITGMRNRMIHGYDVLDISVLHNTITQDLPNLVASLDDILDE